jgi:catechol 2,3-dioxygenase-like lactoylglutathione lyase family enzyme
MSTEVVIHPKLQHYGLATANLDAMIDWYRKVLGMTVNHRSAVQAPPQAGPGFSASAFLSNDEVNHRIAMFEIPGIAADPGKSRHTRVQHVAFAYSAMDDLLDSYVRLKGLGITPVVVTDQGLQVVFYYLDPDQNVVELNVGVYGDEWTATEHVRTQPPAFVPVDPDKLVAAHQAGGSARDLHRRAMAGEFVPSKPFDPRGLI